MTNIKVFASPNTEIMNNWEGWNGNILWEICWQREGEQMQSKLVTRPPNGWRDPILNEFLPEDVIQALIKKYGLGG